MSRAWRAFALLAFTGAVVVRAADANDKGPVLPAAGKGGNTNAAPAANPPSPAAAPKQPTAPIKPLLTVAITDAPPAPLRGYALLSRADVPKDFDPVLFEEVPERRQKALLGGETYTFALRLEAPGTYNLVIKLPGHPELAKTGIVVKGETEDVKFSAKVDRLAELTITVPTALATDPEVRRAKAVWDPANKIWKPADEFESFDAKLKKTGTNFSASLLPWRYRITVRGSDPTPITQDFTLGAGAVMVPFTQDQLERKATFEFSVNPPRPGARYVLEGAGASIDVEPGSDKIKKLDGTGEFRLWLVENGQKKFPVWKGFIAKGASVNPALQSAIFGKGPLVVRADFAPQNHVITDAQNGGRVTPVRLPGDQRLWIDAGRRVFVSVEHNGQMSYPLGPVAVDYFDEAEVRAPPRQEFEAGSVRIEPRNVPRGVAAAKLVFTGTGGNVAPPAEHNVSTLASSTVSLSPGAYQVQASLQVDGDVRTLPVGSVTVVAAARQRDAVNPLPIDFAPFAQGRLAVRGVGNLPADLRVTGKLETGGPAEIFELNRERNVPLGRWLVTASAGGKSVTLNAEVRFNAPATLDVREDYFFSGVVSFYTSDTEKTDITLRGPGGETRRITEFAPETTELFTGMRSATIGVMKNGLVQDGLREGVWVVSGFGREQRVQIRGAQAQAVGVFKDERTWKEFKEEHERVRARLPLAELANENETATTQTNTQSTKTAQKDDPNTTSGNVTNPGLKIKITGGESSEPATKNTAGKSGGDDPSRNAASATWPTHKNVPIEIDGKSLVMIWTDKINGWMAATTVPGDGDLPRALSYADAEQLVTRLNNTYATQRGAYRFAIPSVGDWEAVAGRRSKDELRKLVFGQRAGPEAVASISEGGFSHLYGNVWQWVQPDRDDGGARRLRAVGGSFLTKLEQWPENGLSYLRTDGRRDNVGLRLVLVK